jgi:glycosyltransferase involved in cell wall biosynthesis
VKILIVSQNFYPDNFKINEVAVELKKSGHEVTVLTGLADYSTGHIPKKYRYWKNRNEVYRGIQIHRVRTISRRTGPIFRSLNYLSFAINGWFWGKLQRQSYDLVYVYLVSPVTMGIPAIAVAKKQKVPLVYYNLDLWPESVKAMHINEGTLAFRIIHRISRRVYQAANQIAVSSLPFIDYLHDVNDIDRNKVRFIPQYANEEGELEQNLQIEQLLNEKRSSNNFVFTGNIGYVQDIETIIRAIKILQKAGVTSEQLRIHLVGDGSNLETIKNLVKSLNITDFVVFYGRQPEKLMPNFYQFADACLLTLKNENKIGVTIPAKLQGYMAAKKPVLAAIDGDAQRVIAEANCGIRVNSGDAESLAHAFAEFMKLSTIERQKLGQNGYQYFLKNFTKEKFMTATQDWLIDNLKKENETNGN